MTSATPYVLVHGAWHDAPSWDRVAARRTSAGYRVNAPDLTSHGTETRISAPGISDPRPVAGLTGGPACSRALLGTL